MLKKIFLWFLFGGLMLFGGYATQTDSSALQGMGFFGIVLAFVVLYIIYKIMWTFMSFGMAFLVIGSIVFFILYSLGIIGGDSQVLSSIGGLTDISSAETSGETQYAAADESGVMDTLQGLFTKKKTEPSQAVVEFNPYNYPAVSGEPLIITGNVLKLKSLYIRLFGIDAPDADQTCADRRGKSYNCGQKALTWLQDFIAGRKITCHILGNIVNNRATGACFVGDDDLSAAVAGAGWAVAYTKNTDVYVPYAKEAQRKHLGLWAGQFYLPHDWRKLQSRKIEVEIERRGGGKTKSWFDGWF